MSLRAAAVWACIWGGLRHAGPHMHRPCEPRGATYYRLALIHALHAVHVMLSHGRQKTSLALVFSGHRRLRPWRRPARSGTTAGTTSPLQT